METGEAKAATKAEDDLAALITDPSALQALVENLPGVNPDSDVIKAAVGSAKKAQEEKEKKVLSSALFLPLFL